MGCGATKVLRPDFDLVTAPSTGSHTLACVEASNRDEGIDFDEASYGVRSSALRELVQQFKRDELAKMTTATFCERFVKTRTAKSRNSYAQELFNDRDQRHKVGRAAVCVSHAWSQHVQGLFDAVLDFLEQNQDELGEDPFVWLDFLCVSQHDSDHVDRGWWTSQMFQGIGRMSRVVLILSPLYRPAPLSRLWVIFELLACVENQGQLSIAFAPDQRQRFLDGLKADPRFFLHAAAQLDSSNCDCYFAVDKEALRAEIERRGFTFQDVDQKVMKALEDAWCRLVREKTVDHSEDSVKGEVQKAYGKLLASMGRGQEALVQLEGAVKLLQASEGESGRATLEAMSALGVAYAQEGRIELSKQVSEKVLVQSASLGAQDTNTLTARQTLARVYADSNQHDKALVEHQAVLEAKKATLGEDDEETLQAMISTGASQYSVGDYDAAEQTLRHCLDKRKIVLGPGHQATGLTMSWLGSVYMAQRRYEEAAEMKQGCLEVYRTTLGPDHADTKRAEQNLAAVQGRLQAT